MSKPTTVNYCIKIDKELREMIDILHTHKIRAATIFKTAGEKVIREKYNELIKNYNNPYTNIIKY